MKTPEQITETLWHKSLNFLEKPIKSMIIGGILAGIFVALAAITTLIATFDMADYFGRGFTKLIAGIVFTFGLITIVFSGSELFTGSNMHIISICKDKSCITKILRNWFIIYFSNFAGSLILAFLIIKSGVFDQEAIKTALMDIVKAKMGLTWSQAFIRGLLCNFLVCLAIRVGEASEDASGKILGFIFVIGAFVINSFEHSVANMFYIPTGLMLGANVGFPVTWGSFIVDNLIPVTLGNIVGGGLFIGFLYYWMHSGYIAEQAKIKARDVK